MPHGPQVCNAQIQGWSSGGFLYFAGADARRANADLLPHARHHRAQALQVRIPPAPPRVIRVADHISIMRRFAAEFTLQCHILPASVLFGLGIPARNADKPSSLFYQTLYLRQS